MMVLAVEAFEGEWMPDAMEERLSLNKSICILDANNITRSTAYMDKYMWDF